LRVLIDHGATVGSPDPHGFTPLHRAAYNGHVEVCRMLIDHGANTNAQNWNHETPVHLAIQSRHPKIVELLLERGADVPSRVDEVGNLLREHGSRGG